MLQCMKSNQTAGSQSSGLYTLTQTFGREAFGRETFTSEGVSKLNECINLNF